MRLILILACVIFTIYNVVVLNLFGIPKSLSKTYYLFKEKYNIGWVFPVTLIVIIGLLMPLWLTISQGSIYQFFAFLAPASILFVATAPAFNKTFLEGTVHNVFAVIGVTCAILWIILVTQYWWIFLIITGCITIIAILFKTLKTSCIYWFELSAFISTFITMFLYM